MAKFIISLTKRYHIPACLSIKEIDNLFLVIAPQTANWIILKNKNELRCFDEFRRGASILEAMDAFPKHIDDVKSVVTQLEGRSFCNKRVTRATEAVKSLHIYLTNKCNLSCPHCYMFSGSSNRDEVSSEEVFNLLDDYRNDGRTNVTLSGGEPSIRLDFDQIVRYAASIGLKVRVLTNGTQWNRERITSLARCIDSIQISIDGFSEETNSEIRGNSQFSKALFTIDEFVKQNTNVSVAITPPI